jgi:hypothetical protein
MVDLTYIVNLESTKPDLIRENPNPLPTPGNIKSLQHQERINSRILIA